jgi:hypothetical protein
MDSLLATQPVDSSAASNASHTSATNDTLPAPATPRPRGFAALSPEDRRRLGSKGGKHAHERGTANRFTPESASLAGRKPHENGTAHRWSSEEAREAGRKGGSALRRQRRAAAASASGS